MYLGLVGKPLLAPTLRVPKFTDIGAKALLYIHGAELTRLSSINLQTISDNGLDLLSRSSTMLSLIIDRNVMRLTLLAAIGLITAAGQDAPGAPVLNADQLSALARQVSEFSARDQFDAPPALPSINGKRFSYEVAPLEVGMEGPACDGFPLWYYSADRGELLIAAGSGFLTSFEARSGANPVTYGGGIPEFYSFTCEKTALPSYMATNGFGAQFSVKKQRDRVTAISGPMEFEKNWKPTFKLKADGATARELTRNARIRLSGTLTGWRAGVPVICGTQSSRPTVRLPLERVLEACVIAGRVDHFEVIDSRDGRVLYSSSRRPH